MANTPYSAGTVIASTWLNDVNNVVHKSTIDITTEPYSGSRSASTATNRAAMQAAITAINAAGGGTVIVPSGVDYGFVHNDKTTYPSFSGITTDVTVLDYGIGDADGSGNKAGAQYRAFFHTAQTTPFGMHDGNGHVIFGDWHPYYALNNTATIAAVGDPSRLATDNRRASIFIYNDGKASWRIGQGSLAGAGSTSEELSNFCIQHFNITGDTLTDYTPLIIEKKTGNWGINVGTNSPQFGFHYKNISAGFPQACFESLTTTTDVVLRNSNGSGDDTYLRNASGDLSLRIASQGDALVVTKANRRVSIAQSFAQKRVIVPYSASMTPDGALGNYFTITATNSTAFTINSPDNPADGQFITIKLSNISGGALGAATWNGYKMSSWTNPATGFSRSISFVFDGAAWHEAGRTPADVPN